MDGVLEGMKDESGYNSLGKLGMDKIGFGRIYCKTDKKEGGESQLDVGGKMAIDFRQYTIRQLPRYKAFASS